MTKLIKATIIAACVSLPALVGIRTPIVKAAPITEANDHQIHIVKSGESIWLIAQKWQVGMMEIIRENPEILNPALIYPNQKIKVPVLPQSVKNLENEILRLVNVERSRAGVKALALDWELCRVARIKSQDMNDHYYFSHQSPTYGSPFDMIKKFGITYRSAGENIAQGQPTAAEVMRAWMNSAGHRANILNPSFTHLGVGAYSKYWTQMFIGK